MKINTAIKKAPACLLAIVLMVVDAATKVGAAAPALQGQIAVRPLTPQELKDPSLVGKQGASGLSTVGLGQPAYLEALVNIAIAPSNIVGVTWVLTNKPIGSVAELATSPLGANVPTYKMADRLTTQVAGRTLLRPDVAGQYTVVATIDTTDSGTTNLTQNITAGTYMGINTCALCHSGGILAPDKVTPWSGTLHATMVTRHIDGLDGGYSRSSCITCHTVGYDANTNAVNGAFDDVAKQLGWTFPAVLTNGNWAAMPAALKNVANIQCENCHGPGSQHAFSLGNPNLISTSFAAGNCAQCHDSMTHHFRSAEWNHSGHAVAPRQTSSGCVRCHTAPGFANYAAGAPAVSTPYEAITCAACHDPHDAANPHQLRTVADVTLMDNKTTITEGGPAKLCMNCHMARRDATNYVETTAGSSHFGPHYGCQTDMLMGVNAITYGQEIPSSAHRHVVEEACLTCHMQEAEFSPAFTHAGGHSFNMKWDNGTNTIELTEACVQCHGEIEEFNFKRQDFDSNGIVEGVQTEVHGLLNKLGRMLPPIGDPAVNITSAYTKQQLRAGYNYKFVEEDGSFGVHNLSYAVGLLKASIADLTGDANNDSLSDAWQIQYFGSATNPNAAPNANPAGDGIPNWLKYNLGLDPTVAGTAIPGGVVWANGGRLGGSTDTIQIFTAAEVAFDTEVGKTYQIQAVSSLSGGWQNLGDPIPGTGAAISYTTPLRENAQQFFRVVHTP
ncbi:MAG: hypothetical protein HY674_09095 [Chloroflexi bacterium]|nr:hypothetical protein [Chloroflexota bacterium]